ncbi:Uncharacterized membrane-anchored protein [Parapedobacter composti]|uniref:Uncharacterized membrane-anchored protein n=1 Tax=Parapedobacter composti TaxID=623281 RepID=A0A1I1LPU8_9SPHI|nr:DUF2167 domain-containing protein [Parapedobacter composti]SFC75247.1 Uncharacterized membrane-anchored protein [Parapedobacter composti]
MKKTFIICLFAMLLAQAYSQDHPEDYRLQIDSIERLFTYQRDTIQLRNGIGKIVIPPGFKYLNAEQSERVLVDLWGNPQGPDMTLGMILPEKQGVMSDSGYVFNIQYDEIGYVKDGDADEINYDELLAEMQRDAEEANKERSKAGYEPISIVGWAAPPYYDKERKILHWAKEIQFGNSPEHTLNYNIRVLGRKGVLVLNAISTMPHFTAVRQDLPEVLNIVQFNDGYRYNDFNPSVDEVAGWTIGGLVAGKVLAKAGFFAFLLKFWKFIAIGVVVLVRAFWSKIRGKKAESATGDAAMPDQAS